MQQQYYDLLIQQFIPETVCDHCTCRKLKGLSQIKRKFAAILKSRFNSGHAPKYWSNSTRIYPPKPGKFDYRNSRSFRTLNLRQSHYSRWIESFCGAWKLTSESPKYETNVNTDLKEVSPRRQHSTKSYTKLKNNNQFIKSSAGNFLGRERGL